MFRKHLISAIMVTTLIVSASATPVMAASTMGGSVELTNSKVTPFRSVKVGGGTWDYGTEIIGSQKHVWSIYDHDKKEHKASTKLGSDSDTSGWIEKGTTATSELYGNKSNTGKAYWNTR